jgi:hypothetical protein
MPTINFSIHGFKTIVVDEPIIFDKVLANEGGGYDQVTGIFTVPVAGMYTFTATLRGTMDAEETTANLQAGF